MVSYYSYDAAYKPNLTSVKKYGIGINGYITGIYRNSTTQPSTARAAGLGYHATYEEGPSELVNASVTTGKAVGQKILDAFERLKIPMNGSVAVYPSVDVSAGATSCNNAWEGILSKIHGKISLRAYAEGAIISALAKAKLVEGKCWLAAPTSWPGYSVSNPNVGIIQLVGTNVGGTDRNHIIVDPSELGFWWPAGSPFAGGLHMDADVKAAFDALKAEVAAIAAAVKALPDRVWQDDIIPISPLNKDNPTWGAQNTLGNIQAHVMNAENHAASAASGSNAAMAQVTALAAQVKTLQEAVEAAPQAAVDLSGQSFPATVMVSAR